MPCLHDLGKRREFSERVEVGVLLHVVVVGVAVLDRRAEQADGSLRTVTTFRLVLPGERPARPGRRHRRHRSAGRNPAAVS